MVIPYKFYFLTEEDYRGLHTAPDKGSGAPLYDVTGVYPDDIYTDPNAGRYYGDNSGDIHDNWAINVIRLVRNKPNARVRIYRAVPKIISNQDKINQYQNEKKYILKYGKVPRDVETKLNSSAYYDKISKELEILLKDPSVAEEKKVTINPGDWVTISHRYASLHGESTLLNKYRILTKTVPAKHLFTTGDTLFEFGYQPHD